MLSKSLGFKKKKKQLFTVQYPNLRQMRKKTQHVSALMTILPQFLLSITVMDTSHSCPSGIWMLSSFFRCLEPVFIGNNLFNQTALQTLSFATFLWDRQAIHTNLLVNKLRRKGEPEAQLDTKPNGYVISHFKLWTSNMSWKRVSSRGWLSAVKFCLNRWQDDDVLFGNNWCTVYTLLSVI